MKQRPIACTRTALDTPPLKATKRFTKQLKKAEMGNAMLLVGLPGGYEITVALDFLNACRLENATTLVRHSLRFYGDEKLD